MLLPEQLPATDFLHDDDDDYDGCGDGADADYKEDGGGIGNVNIFFCLKSLYLLITATGEFSCWTQPLVEVLL